MPHPLSRRHFARTAAAAALAGPQLFLPRSTQAAEILETRVISHQPHYYHGWPTLARRRSGELVLAWSGRRQAHVCPFGSVEMMRSRDDGASWTFPQTVHDSPIDDRDAGALETAAGTLLITSFTSLAYAPQVAPGGGKAADALWLGAHHRLPSDEARQARLGTWLFRSTDDAASFSAPIDTIVNSPHGPCQLADGRLLYAGKQLWAKERRIGLSVSDDDGLSWHWLAEIPTRPGDHFAEYHELHAVECPGGKIVAHIRNHNKADHHETLQTSSDDGGKTWAVPHPIGVWGLPSHLVLLADGRLLMTYGHRRQPFGNQARLSDDLGETWSDPIILSADGAGGDLGYPSTVQLADASLLTVWYERLPSSPLAQLRQARWTPPS